MEQEFVIVLLGFFVCLLSFIFWMIDERSLGLLEVTKSGLQKWEENLNTKAQLFTIDKGRSHKWIRYVSHSLRVSVCIRRFRHRV